MSRTHSPLTTGFSITSDSSPRFTSITAMGMHHAAGTSLSAALALFQPGGRQVSPNYCIYRKEIILVVPENRRAWTTSDADADSRSITAEIINETAGPLWSFHQDTIQSVIAWSADCARYYNMPFKIGFPSGFWQHRNMYEWYGRSYPTACAGPSFDLPAITAAAAAYKGPFDPNIELEELMAGVKSVSLKKGKNITVLDFQTGFKHTYSGGDPKYDNTVAKFLTDNETTLTLSDSQHAKLLRDFDEFFAEQDARNERLAQIASGKA